MAVEIVIMKTPQGLVPATPRDAELVEAWPFMQGIRCKVVQLKPRSLRHHRMYWGGLVELTFDYWEPNGGLITPREENFAKVMARWIDRQLNGDGGSKMLPFFLEDLAKSRADKLPAVHKTREGLHTWIKEQAGYFDLVLTPTGTVRQAQSINWNSMDQDEFNQFYKAAFNVCWQYILSRTFGNPEEAQQAMDNLLALG